MAELKLDPHELAILLIDVQPFFISQMVGSEEPVLIRLEQLLIMSNWFQLPVLATCEEPVDRKGELPERLQAKFPNHGQLQRKQTYDLPLTYKSLHYELLKTENSDQWQAGHEAAIAAGLLNVESLPPIGDA